jgi:hypothetical protein
VLVTDGNETGGSQGNDGPFRGALRETKAVRYAGRQRCLVPLILLGQVKPVTDRHISQQRLSRGVCQRKSTHPGEAT